MIVIVSKETRETGLEPATSAVTGRCSNQLNYSRRNIVYGRNRTRTYDHLCVRQELYQLSYTPTKYIKNVYNVLIFGFFLKDFLKDVFLSFMYARINIYFYEVSDASRFCRHRENQS